MFRALIQPRLGPYLVFFFCCVHLFLPSRSFAQLVDVNACSGNLTRCVTVADSFYTMCFNVIPASICSYKKFTINWGDNTTTETVQGPGPVKVEHKYNLTDFVKNCRNGGVTKYNIEIITDCPGDNIVRKLTFLVKPNLAIDIPDVCQGKSVFFRNNTCPSSSDIANDIVYKWDFGDGTTSSNNSPTHTFPTTQPAYTMTVSATNTCGTDTKQYTIPIKKTPVASYTTTGYTVTNQDTVVCLNNGGTLTLDGTVSIDESRYQWTITPNTYRYVNNTNSSSPVVKIQFSQSGDYTITLTALNDCGTSAPLISKHRVVNVPQVTITPQPDACTASTYTLTNATPNAIYILTNGPTSQTLVPNQPVATPESTMPYVVRAELSNQCGNTQTPPDTFYIQSPQPVQITAPARQTALCAGATRIQLITNSTGGTWDGSGKPLLEIQNGNTYFNPKKTGQYTLIYYKGTGACLRSDTTRIAVEGSQVTAQSLSSCDAAGFVKLQGTPSGGTWSSTAYPTAIRNDTLFLAGITVTQLELTYKLSFGTAGCQTSATATISIGKPKAIFSLTGQCTDKPIVVTNTSTGADTFEWINNNVTIATGRQPALNLPAGQQTITLRAKSGSCQNEAQQTITLTAPPASISISPSTTSGCSPLPITFSASNTVQPGMTYQWSYGDGSFGNSFLPSTHTYKNSGQTSQVFTATLTASNNCGIRNATTSVTVRPLAFAEIGVDSTNVRCTPARIRFSNRSVGQGQISLWSFGDGTVRQTSQDTILHLFSARDSARTFRVSLIVENSCGRDTDAVSIRVYPTIVRPLFNLSNARPCAGELVQFTDASVPRPTSWVWRFSDGTTETIANPQHRFSEANKSYAITLIAYTPCGYDSLRRTIQTTAPPAANFTASTPYACQEQAVTFVNQSNPANRFRWSFGDGSALDSVNFSPKHTFPSTQTSAVISLSVIGTTGSCVSTTSQTIPIRSALQSDFTVEGGSDACASTPVRLVSSDSRATQFRWEISNGQRFTTAKPELILPPGQYDVKLFVSYDQGGCPDSSSRSRAINVLSCEVVAPDAFTPNADGVSDSWTLFSDSGASQIARLRIWNRWGEVIFDVSNIPLNSRTPGECWDGTNRGVPMPTGQYPFEADILMQGGNYQKKTGSIALLR